MLVVNEDQSIYATRGDALAFDFTATVNGEAYLFRPGEKLRFKVFEKKNCGRVFLQKDFLIEKETDSVALAFYEEEMKIGPEISKPTDYWYEVELNPGNNPQTVIGYDEDGAKILKLFPEGGSVNE